MTRRSALAGWMFRQAKGSRRLRGAVAVVCCLLSSSVQAEVVRVAVASNFVEAARALAHTFERNSGHQTLISSGSTGQLFAQIAHQAPFHVFLAADRARPRKAVDDGLAVAGSRFTYAIGRLVLYSRDPGRVRDGDTLTQGGFSRLAIANPRTAPYGRAAVEAMRALGVYPRLRTALVEGQNIGQTYQFVATGNAELGLVARAQVARHQQGSRWLLPADLHAPIAQDAVLLKHGEHHPAAQAFLAFLRSTQARAIIESFGYQLATTP